LKNSEFTDEKIKKYFKIGTYEELDELLHYTWNLEKLALLKEKNIKLEVFLGENDKIIDAKKALEFFRKFGEVYFIKNKGHIL